MRIASLLAAGLLAFALPASAQQPLSEGVGETPNLRVSFETESAAGHLRWAHVVERLGSQYLRLRISGIEDRSGADYALVIRDRNGRAVLTLTKSALSGLSDLWTDVILGDYARLELTAAAPPTGLSFVLSEIVYQRIQGVPFSISLPDEREHVVEYRAEPRVFNPSRAVAKLSFISGGVPFTCTGFMIDDERMLTNEHCVNTAAICRSTVAIFGYEYNEKGQLGSGEQFRCQELLAVDFNLDVALLKLAGSPGKIWGRLPLNTRNAAEGEQAYMIQHPAGEPKQISRKGCAIRTRIADGRTGNSDLGHVCDTLGGSSGSPLLGADFTVIGLHHFGFGSDDRWRGENRAVRMEPIMRQLQLQ